MFFFHIRTVAWAQEPRSQPSVISIAPTFQELTLEPNQTSQNGQITVTNQTETAQSFDVIAYAMSQLDSQGNPILTDKPPSNAETPVSSVISFSEPAITVGPDQKKTITFTVTNTQELTPGGNYAVIVLRTKPDQPQLTTAQSVLPAISSFVLIRKIGGEQYNLSLSQISNNTTFFLWQLPNSQKLVFENQGNIHTTPRGQVKMKDVFGRVIVEGTINESSQFVFPRTQREIAVQLRQIRPSWPIMLYTTTNEGRSEPGDIVFSQNSLHLYVSPVAVTLLFLTFLVLSLGYFVFHKTQQKKKTHRVT